jgi:hypothetical protein
MNAVTLRLARPYSILNRPPPLWGNTGKVWVFSNQIALISCTEACQEAKAWPNLGNRAVTGYARCANGPESALSPAWKAEGKSHGSPASCSGLRASAGSGTETGTAYDPRRR